MIYIEIYYILRGQGILYLNASQDPHDLIPDTVSFIPGGTVHSVVNTGLVDLEMITVMPGPLIEGVNTLYAERKKRWGSSLRKTNGSIINVSSLVGSMGQEGASTYCATKGGITAFTKALAVDEGRHGVRVNAILPGVIGTPMHSKFINSQPNPDRAQEDVDAWQWLGRIGTIEEVGYACLFLASDGATFITGIELIISGGAELAYGIKLPKQILHGQ